jgi:D-glycero-beta-D-manno-heptose-7-phosphate kinase
MGLVGADRHADQLRTTLAESGINLDCIQSDSLYQTIVKTRIIARQLQVVRVDRERAQPRSEELQRCSIEKIRSLLPEIDGIIFEDYGKGFLQQTFVDEVASLGRRAGKVVTADPNAQNRLTWRGMTAVKPNRGEAFVAVNQPWHEPELEPMQDELKCMLPDGLDWISNLGSSTC